MARIFQNTDHRRELLGKALLSLLLLLAVTDLQTTAAVTPQIALGLETTATAVTYGFVVYSLAAVSAALLLRRFAGRCGRTELLTPTAFLYALSCLLAALAPNISFFIFSRFLSGFAGGFVSALAITALAAATSYKTRGKNMSLISFSYYMAPMLGVPVGTFLTGLYSWRIVFALTAGLIFLSGLLIRLFPLASAGKTAVAAAAGRGGGGLARSPGAVGTDGENPDDLSGSLRMGIISAFFVSGGLIGFTTFIGAWLFDALRATPNQVGAAYALLNVGALTGGILGGFLADRFGKRPAALHPNLLIALGFLSLPLLSGVDLILPLIIVIAFAAALRVAPLQALLTGLAAAGCREQGAAAGKIASYIATRNISSQLGIGSAILLCGQIYYNYGLKGVSLVCALFTIGAWWTVRAITEPAEKSVAAVGPARATAYGWSENRPGF